jgi:hypothetical protein
VGYHGFVRREDDPMGDGATAAVGRDEVRVHATELDEIKRGPVTSVEAALEVMGANLERVRGKTNRLIERVGPLLGPERADARLHSAGDEPTTSAHVAALMEHAGRLASIEFDLDDVLQRLEIS